MRIIGIDLSGPANVADTVGVSFRGQGRQLCRDAIVCNAADTDIVEFIGGIRKRSSVVVGLDAPLSYNIGGGFRPSDRLLHQRLRAEGRRFAMVMPPTLTRMVYLTLRGVCLARLLKQTGESKIDIVEVHPGAAMALRHAPQGAIRAMKRSPDARRQLLAWLEAQGLGDAGAVEAPGDHYVAACAAALAAWRWKCGDPAWLYRAEPPYHPFDFAC
jgi:predicted nuclease with RNAse H fold